MLDCANDYDNEHVIGEALKELFAAGVVKREELFVQVRLTVSAQNLWKLSVASPFLHLCLQAKLWNSNHRPEHVRPDIMKTLEDLQVWMSVAGFGGFVVMFIVTIVAVFGFFG